MPSSSYQLRWRPLAESARWVEIVAFADVINLIVLLKDTWNAAMLFSDGFGEFSWIDVLFTMISSCPAIAWVIQPQFSLDGDQCVDTVSPSP